MPDMTPTDTAVETTVETAPTETTPAETTPAETAPAPTVRPPQPCGRCATPTQHRRYVHTSGLATTQRSLWCEACVRSNASRCTECTATVAGPSRVSVTTSAYGDTKKYCVACVSRRVENGSIRMDHDDNGTPVLVVASLYIMVIGDMATPDAGTIVRLNTVSTSTCSGHVGRWPGAPTCRVVDAHVVATSDGHIVCTACLPRLPVCTACRTPTGDTRRYAETGTPHPQRQICLSCETARQTAADLATVRIGTYHNTASRGYRPTGQPSTSRRPKTRNNPSPSDGLRFGVELELCVSNAHETRVAGEIRDQLGPLWAGAERDGSVAGIECPTQPGDIDTHRRVWSNFKRPRDAHTNSTCGLHVHMSRSAMTPGQIQRIGYLLNHHADASQWDRVFRRQPGTYCQRSSHGMAYWVNGGSREKYSITNLAPSRTIEIRQPAGTLNGPTIAATVEILWCVYLYTLSGNPGAVYSRSAGLSWDGLIRWLTTDPMARSESKLARAYLCRIGLLTAPVRKGPTPPVDTSRDGIEVYSPSGGYVAPNWEALRFYDAVPFQGREPVPNAWDDMDIDDAGPDGLIAF